MGGGVHADEAATVEVNDRVFYLYHVALRLCSVEVYVEREGCDYANHYFFRWHVIVLISVEVVISNVFFKRKLLR